MWHKRLAHRNFKDLQKLNLEIDKSALGGELCDSCVHAKHHREPYDDNPVKAESPLDLVYSDVCEPIILISRDGKRYFATFLDDNIPFVYVYTMFSKDELFNKFKEYHAEVTNRFGRNIRELCSVNGGEYVSKEMIAFCRSQGIVKGTTTPCCPQQNGRAERMNSSLVERARAVLIGSSLPKECWSDAILYAAYTIDRCPTVGGIVPAVLWFKKPVDYSRLRIFGIKAYMLKV